VTAVLPDLANTGLTPMPMSQRMFGRPPSCICDDVIILHPVIDFHDRNIFPYFHVVVVGLVVSVRVAVTVCATSRQTETDIVIAIA